MKLFKKIFINIVAVMLVFCAVNFGACAKADIKQVELTVAVYDYDQEKETQVTITVDMYRHLAPKTVDKMISYVNEGYYDDVVLYNHTSYGKQIMLGDFKFDTENETLVQNAIKPELEASEFYRGGTVGSNLKNEKGAIGVWRSWYQSDASYTTNSNALTSARATWYMPTAEISAYNDWFCVFAKIDFTAEGNKEAFDLIEESNGSSAEFKDYEIYYTGEYDATAVNDNYGLTFNCVDQVEFSETTIANLFKAKGEQLTCFDHYTVKIAVTPDGLPAIKIVSAKVK